MCFNLYINDILQYLLFSLTCFTLTLQFRLLCTADILLYLAIVLPFCCCMVFYYMQILLLFVPLLMDIWVVSGLGYYRAATAFYAYFGYHCVLIGVCMYPSYLELPSHRGCVHSALEGAVKEFFG